MIKKTPTSLGSQGYLHIVTIKSAAFGLETIPAVDRTVAGGLERNRGFNAAFGASGRIHLAFAMHTAALLFAGCTAAGTTARLIFKAFGSIKFLLIGRKNELLTAVFTRKGLVLIHIKKPPVN